ncbi:MAG: DUF5828 family protein [Candidatus Nanohaloarchaea archaeon]
MADDEVEETNSGVKKRGEWHEIQEFARDVEEALEESEVEEDSVEKYRDWRPREDDDRKNVKEKTVEAAAVEEKPLEKESEGVKNDLGEASEKVKKIGQKVREKQNPQEEVKDASKDAVKPFYSGILKWFRRFEKTVYSAIILRFNSYYFDTKDFSVDVKEKKGEYQMNINVSEEEKRDEIKRKIEEKEG